MVVNYARNDLVHFSIIPLNYLLSRSALLRSSYFYSDQIGDSTIVKFYLPLKFQRCWTYISFFRNDRCDIITKLSSIDLLYLVNAIGGHVPCERRKCYHAGAIRRNKNSLEIINACHYSVHDRVHRVKPRCTCIIDVLNFCVRIVTIKSLLAENSYNFYK